MGGRRGELGEVVGGGERPRLLKAEAATGAHSWPAQNAGRRRVPRSRGRRAPRDASGTRVVMKTTTYNLRVIIKKLTAGCTHLQAGPWRQDRVVACCRRPR
jgi:hypothetical protein